MSQPYDPAPRFRAPEPTSYETRRETEAALSARMELGPEYTEHIAAGLADRVEQLAALRTAELRHQDDRSRFEEKLEKDAQSQRFVLGIISLGAGVPITAITATNVTPGLLGVAVAWAGIVGVNVANALANRRRR
jgi:hypothetical protein